MALIDSKRLKFFMHAVQQARVAWEAAREHLQTADRHDRSAWAQAQTLAEQAFGAYNDKARDVTTVLQLLIEQAEAAARAHQLSVGLPVQARSQAQWCAGFGVRLPRQPQRPWRPSCLLDPACGAGDVTPMALHP